MCAKRFSKYEYHLKYPTPVSFPTIAQLLAKKSRVVLVVYHGMYMWTVDIKPTGRNDSN